MKLRLQILVFSVTLLLSGNTFAQYIQVDDTYTATQLVRNFFSGGGCATVDNISVSGGNFGTSEQSFGFFDKSTSRFPFANGIVLSTGKSTSAIGPNSSILSDGNGDWVGDSDLESALGVSNTINATVLEFDFTPITNKISFDYIFSSEQYLSNPSASQCGYTDGFAFLLKPLGSSTYKNLAIVPGTSIPVTVNNVRGSGTRCSTANEAYFDAFNGTDHPTNFNGQTVIMKAEADVISGTTYHIKLVIADQGNNLYDSAIFLGGGSFESATDLGINHLVSTNNAYCSGENITLNATQTGTNTYKWFKDGIDTGITSPTFPITDNTNTAVVEYSVEVTINGACISKGKVKIQFATLPVLINQTLVQCDDNNDGSTIFNLNKLDNLIKNPNDTTLSVVMYYETIGGAAIPNPSRYSSIPKTIFAEVANSFGCKSIAQVTLQIDNTVNLPYLREKCDEVGVKDGKTTFDLNAEITPNIAPGLLVEYYATINNAIIQNSPLPNNYPNVIPNEETIFARIVNGPDCNGIVEVTLKVNFLKPANFEDKTIGLCQGSSVFLNVDPVFSSYTWNNGDADFETEVFTAGNYSVEVTDANGCKATKKFIVNLSAPATNIDALINDLTGNNNNITITYTDNGGDYEFSIDGKIYQDSPQFYNVLAGEYTISVRDKNGCLPTPFKTIYVLDYPKFFTPNGDGINDTWVIKNIKTKPNSTINIFDRFGKLLKQIDSNSPGWNGTYNGINLPSGDYWFVLTLFNNKTVKSHFTLKR
ncbi:choice-of-anchor L domain-containing protein [Flavobacterium sp.]|uniref:T9SS type B sorting domain-containing protein n=1 Tax=Flavobacterium sp. TaxID=239 RepID=UPI003750FD43